MNFEEETAMPEKHVVLIVDDTPENLRVLGDMLEEQGYEVLVATGGPQAMETVKASPPDLILLDILMPEMDGYEVCRRLKSDPLLKLIPVIFLSVLDMPEQKIQAFRAGAVDYITKPFQSEEVVARVHTHLQLTQVEALKHEIAVRKIVEQALQEQAEELSAIYENAPLIMMIVNESCLIQKINSPISALTTLPISEIAGRPIGEIINCIHAQGGCGQTSDCQACAICQTVLHTFDTGESQQHVQGHLRFSVGGAPQDRFFLISAKRLNFRERPALLLCLLDVSEQHRLQEQIIQQQKLESIGTLAGGIAHDFNNILNAIVGYTDLALLRGADQPTDLRDDLSQVRKAADRATQLVRQILTFSRKQYQEKQPLQVSLIIKEALKLLRASIPTTIEIRQEIISEATVLADPTQIHQMVMNLCTNAYHAMMERGGVLGVSLKEILIEQKMFDSDTELPPGCYVVLSVSDTGCGMDKEILGKIFDPYFTTKGLGKGTGLGLAVVHGIIKSHQGQVAVYSEPGNGSTFNVYLPMIAQEATLAAAALVAAPMAKAHERIMVVDDESAIRDLTCQFLTMAGYQVEAFANGAEAWQALSVRPDGWDLLLTDQTMPEMTGEQLAAKVIGIRPDMPIILCSGYMKIANGGRAKKKTGVFTSLQKPVDRNTLLTEIAKALAHKS